MTCPTCHAETTGDALFCEACGAALVAVPASAVPASAVPASAVPDLDGAAADNATATTLVVTDTDLAGAPTTCADCGGRYLDGYCDRCGAAVPRIRDHWADVPSAWVAAVCDRGLRHSRNEDAMAVAATPADASNGGRAVLVVCDGVSSAPLSDIASLAAARAARNALVAGRDLTVAGAAAQFQASGGRSGPYDVPTMAISIAAIAAAAADSPVLAPPELSDPSFVGSAATLVMAVVEPSPHRGVRVSAGWVGDSRAYWLPDDPGGEAVQLSIDDSWASEAIAHGVPREDAERLPQAHAITRWLGPDSPDAMPRRATREVVEPGWVLVCSDGLWNYVSPAHQLAELVRRLSDPASRSGAVAVVVDPETLAERLVAWAVDQGGHDNITVALARVSPTGKD